MDQIIIVSIFACGFYSDERNEHHLARLLWNEYSHSLHGQNSTRDSKTIADSLTTWFVIMCKTAGGTDETKSKLAKKSKPMTHSN
jgi:hypothetical protein